MICLVIGPNGSGKSAYAEGLAVSLNKGELLYIATMVPVGDDGRRRVEKHRKMRAGKGFHTYETDGRACDAPVQTGSTVLLEDASNLLANAMFANGGSDAHAVLADILELAAKCDNLICVSIGGLETAEGYDGGTNEYINQLNTLNGLLWERADEVVELKEGSALKRKGSMA